MDIDTSDIILNPILGCKVIWQCLFEATKTQSTIPLPLVALVLPITFHQRSRKFIYKMQKLNGSIAKAVNKNAPSSGDLASGKDLLLGLQERYSYFAPLTLSSINLGISAGIITIADNEVDGFPSYTVGANKLPTEVAADEDPEIKEQLQASMRLGAWFSSSDIPSIYSSLRLKV